MARYAIVDLANLFHRCQFVTRGDAFTKAGMALHIVFNSLRRIWKDMGATHMVFCVEGRSWRYDVYPAYKAKRHVDRMARTVAEEEEHEAMMGALDGLVAFLSEKTRSTVLQSPGVEGDDFVARWIQLHPDDDHVILSGDSDFIQLLAPNVTIVDGVQGRIIRTDAVTDLEGRQQAFTVDAAKGKIKVQGPVDDLRKAFEKAEKQKAKADPTYVVKPYRFEIETEWWRKALFIKIVRGDAGDGIFSAYPGVRYEGTKTKTGIREAWEDRHAGGYHWNNFMLQRWEKFLTEGGSVKSKDVRVLDEFRFNESLIDLTKQPEPVKALMDEVIIQAVQKEPPKDVGRQFLIFCHKWSLEKVAKDAADHARYLNLPYGR